MLLWQRAPQNLLSAHQASLKAANPHLSARQLVSRESLCPFYNFPSNTHMHLAFILFNYCVSTSVLSPPPRNRMDNGPSLISSITLPPSSPSPSFSDSTPGGGSLLNGPHSYTPASESLKVSPCNKCCGLLAKVNPAGLKTEIFFTCVFFTKKNV